MKYKLKMLSMLSMILLFLTTPMVHATVYQASATHSTAYPTLTLAVAIDTDADIWTATWHGKSYLLTPPSVFYAFTIIFEDDKGFSEEYTSWLGEDLDPSGTITIEDYTQTNTWTHTWCRWEYFFPTFPFGFGFVLPELWIDLYIGSSGGGGGGPICPTLFVWNGVWNDFGVIDIHANEDVVREVSVSSESVGINNSKAQFRLREGWEGLTYSLSEIDQVKLYAVDDDGNQRLCPLVKATHSELGNVLPQLLLSDNWKCDMYLLKTIDLEFVVSQTDGIQDFIFIIEGNNMLKY